MKRMKNYWMILVFLAFSSISKAQCIYNGLGFEAGYVRSTITSKTFSTAGILATPPLNSFSLFVTKKAPVSRKISMLYRAGYIRQGFESSEGYRSHSSYYSGMRFHRLALDASFQIPLSNRKIKPYFGLGIRGLATFHSSIDNPFKYDPDYSPEFSANDFRKVDLALLPAFGVQFGPQWRLETSMNFGLLKTMKSATGNENYNQNFAVSLGYSLAIPSTHRKHKKLVPPKF